jgi:predicted CoA-binding protein
MRVMVIGASTRPTKYGYRAVLAFRRQGHTVLPVNPRADQVAGLRCYHTIGEVPGPIDRATLYLPAEKGLVAVRELAERGDVKELWLNPGADDPEVIAAAEAAGFTPIIACSIVAIGETP